MAERDGRPSPEALLAAAKQEDRGRLKIFLGAAPGVAILLARATVTSIFGLRASICASHEPLGAPRRLAC